MPTAEELERDWAAQWALHGGHPPGPEHEDRLREDPAYRASHEASTQHNVEASRGSGVDIDIVFYFDKKNRRIVKVVPQKKILLFEGGEIIGLGRYEPRTGRQTVELFQTGQ